LRRWSGEELSLEEVYKTKQVPLGDRSFSSPPPQLIINGISYTITSEKDIIRREGAPPSLSGRHEIDKRQFRGGSEEIPSTPLPRFNDEEQSEAAYTTEGESEEDLPSSEPDEFHETNHEYITNSDMTNWSPSPTLQAENNDSGMGESEESDLEVKSDQRASSPSMLPDASNSNRPKMGSVGHPEKISESAFVKCKHGNMYRQEGLHMCKKLCKKQTQTKKHKKHSQHTDSNFKDKPQPPSSQNRAKEVTERSLTKERSSDAQERPKTRPPRTLSSQQTEEEHRGLSQSPTQDSPKFSNFSFNNYRLSGRPRSPLVTGPRGSGAKKGAYDAETEAYTVAMAAWEQQQLRREMDRGGGSLNLHHFTQESKFSKNSEFVQIQTALSSSSKVPPRKLAARREDEEGQSDAPYVPPHSTSSSRAGQAGKSPQLRRFASSGKRAACSDDVTA
jgi:hypothetical protein